MVCYVLCCIVSASIGEISTQTDRQTLGKFYIGFNKYDNRMGGKNKY